MRPKRKVSHCHCCWVAWKKKFSGPHSSSEAGFTSFGVFSVISELSPRLTLRPKTSCCSRKEGTAVAAQESVSDLCISFIPCWKGLHLPHLSPPLRPTVSPSHALNLLPLKKVPPYHLPSHQPRLIPCLHNYISINHSPPMLSKTLLLSPE